jgi:hypothetical protein
LREESALFVTLKNKNKIVKKKKEKHFSKNKYATNGPSVLRVCHIAFLFRYGCEALQFSKNKNK